MRQDFDVVLNLIKSTAVIKCVAHELHMLIGQSIATLFSAALQSLVSSLGALLNPSH